MISGLNPMTWLDILTRHSTLKIGCFRQQTRRMQDCEHTRNLCNVHQRQSTRSKPNAETLQSRRHSTRNLLQYRIHPLIHPHADLTFVQQLLVEQSCEKYTVKVATTGNYSLSTVVQSLLEWQQQLRTRNAPIGVQTSEPMQLIHLIYGVVLCCWM